MVLIPIWILKDDVELVLSSAPVSYFDSNFLLKIPIDSGLNYFERKFNSLQLFWNRENQISMFPRPKMRFKLLLKIITFFEHFSVFWNFLSVSLSNLFFKSFLLKLREGISLPDKLEQIWCWSPFEILKES